MNPLAGFLVLYVLIVGWKGNAGKAVDEVSADSVGFVPWAFAIATLVLIQQTKAKPLVAPFVTLAILSTLLKKFSVISTDVKNTYGVLKGTK
jgi:hypothetical protein